MLVAQREALWAVGLTPERLTTGCQLETFSSLAVSLSVHIRKNRVCAWSMENLNMEEAGLSGVGAGVGC